MAAAFVRTAVSTSQTPSFDIGSQGTARRVFLLIDDESTSASVTAVTCDGKTMTKDVQAVNTAGAGNNSQIWSIDEATLGSSNGTVSFALTGGDTGHGKTMELYTGVKDGAPTDTATDTTSTDTTANCPNVTNAIGDLIIMVAGNGQGGRTASWTSPLIERNDGGGAGDPSSADMANASVIETAQNTNKEYVCTWSGSTLRTSACCAVYAEEPPAEGITDVDPEEFKFDNADVDINGLNFEAVIGTGAVYLSDANTLAGSANEVDITNAVNTWSDTVINLDFTSLSAGEITSLHTLGPGQRYLIVVNDSADEYGSPVLTVHRPTAFEIVLSNVTPGSQTVVVSGTGTGIAGRLEETAAQNPSTTTVDVAADGHRNDGLSIQFNTDAVEDYVYEFALFIGDTPYDTYTKYAEVKLVAGGTDVALTGQSIATALGTIIPANSVPLVGSEIAIAQGTLVATLGCPLTGQEVATEQGSLGVDIQVPLVGQEIATEQGSVTAFEQATDELVGQEIATEQGSLGVDIQVPLVGLEIVTAQGVLTPDLKVPLVGLEIATELGTLVPTEDNQVALTGLEVATEQGAFGITHTNPLSGSEVATEQGSLVPALDKALTGQEVGTEQGSLGIAYDAALSGQEVAVEQGSVGVDITVPLVGLEVAASLGILSTDSKVALTGQEVASELGNVGVDLKVAILGEEIATALGIISPQVGADVSLPLSGQEVGTELGTLGVINTAPGGTEEGQMDTWRKRRWRQDPQRKRVTTDQSGFSTRHINVTIRRR